MADVNLDQVLPVVLNLAERKATAFVRRYGLFNDQHEDVQSELVLTFLARWPKFDGTRASVQTFASRLMDSQLTSLFRYHLAQRRRIRDVPMPAAGPTSAARHQFQVDLERAIAPLPAVVRKTAYALSRFSAVDAANVLGCSRQMINRRKHQIRNAFTGTGLTSSYFAGGGGRP